MATAQVAGSDPHRLGHGRVYFPVKWAYWLAETIPGAKPPIELRGARIFFPEERADEFNRLLRDHYRQCEVTSSRRHRHISDRQGWGGQMIGRLVLAFLFDAAGRPQNSLRRSTDS
jgi:hypothetical protein